MALKVGGADRSQGWDQAGLGQSGRGVSPKNNKPVPGKGLSHDSCRLYFAGIMPATLFHS